VQMSILHKKPFRPLFLGNFFRSYNYESALPKIANFLIHFWANKDSAQKLLSKAGA
jgi:hypothetical protein